MKNLLITGPLLLVIACGPNSSQTTEKRVSSADSAKATSVEQKVLNVKPAAGYFSRNDIRQNDTIACWIFETAAERDSVLGIAKTMNNVIDTADFNKEVMAVVTLAPSSLTQELRLSSATQTEDAANLHFAIKIDTPKRTSTSAAVWVGILPKSDVKKVNFYRGDEKIKTIDIDK